MPEPSLQAHEGSWLGWDVGGAHVKAAWWRHDGDRPRIAAVMQVACPLWQGLAHLDAAVDAVFTAWPQARLAGQAMTMTGELADGFEHREAGVQAIAQRMAERTGAGEALRVFAGTDAQSRPLWLLPSQAAAHWPQIASANWLATALAVAQALPAGVEEALLVDIGSTTTDLIPLHAGRGVLPVASDADRLASGALVYHGVVRTPLCALGTRVRWRGKVMNVMHEFFATTADVYRLTGELLPEHDQFPAADQGPKDAEGSRRRIARMVGLDARDGDEADWLALAQQWRGRQLDELHFNARRVIDTAALPGDVPLVAAGCGDFLIEELAARLRRPVLGVDALWPVAPHVRAWMKVAAPSAAVALLAAADPRSQGTEAAR